MIDVFMLLIEVLVCMENEVGWFIFNLFLVRLVILRFLK